MKIIFLNIYNGLVNRGAERSTDELCQRLNQNHKVILIQGGKKLPQQDYQVIQVNPIFPKISDSSLSFLRLFYLDLWSLQILIFSIISVFIILREKPDYIVPINGSWQSFICKVLARFIKAKMVIIGRAGIGRDDHFNLLVKPDVFVALTKKAYKWAKEIRKNPNTKYFYIPNGINLNLFHPNGSVFKSGLKKPIILCVASLMPNKRIDLVIKAVANLKELSLLIIGEGNEKQNLQNLATKLLGQNRYKIVSVSPKDMPGVYREADIFTMVSKEGEAFGNVYLEAMACGLPIIATDDETRREIIGKDGFYLDPNDSIYFSKLIREMLKKNFSSITLDQAKKYSWDRIIKKYEEIFK